MQPRIPFCTSPDPKTPPTCRCFTFTPLISFPTMTVPCDRERFEERQRKKWRESEVRLVDLSYITCKSVFNH